MEIYLPLAGMPINIFTILLLGLASGLLSGMFGIGGAFLVTPLLMFMGISPAVAVSAATNQSIAASFSGAIGHFRKGTIDYQIASYMLLGGFLGANLGFWIFKYLKEVGQIDFAISLGYIFILGTIGLLMAYESFRVIYFGERVLATERKRWLNFGDIKLPFIKYYVRSEIKASILVPILIGFFTSILVGLMGIGGGFLMVPAMIYILKMPSRLVVGTSLVQIMITASIVSYLQASSTNTLDVILAFLIMCGSSIGAQYGMKIGLNIRPEVQRASLAVIILVIVFRLAYGLFIRPESLYEIIMI